MTIRNVGKCIPEYTTLVPRPTAQCSVAKVCAEFDTIGRALRYEGHSDPSVCGKECNFINDFGDCYLICCYWQEFGFA
jgi:hypothetical protein